MNLIKNLASRIREIMLDGKWVVQTNFKEQLTDITYEQAITKIGSLNTIADLTFHIDYYLAGLLQVLEGGALDIRDKYSFDYIPPKSQQEWEVLRNKLISDAEKFAACVEKLSEKELAKPFVDEKYGDYLRNINAMIDHCYYHLGQIALIKKLILEQHSK